MIIKYLLKHYLKKTLSQLQIGIKHSAIQHICNNLYHNVSRPQIQPESETLVNTGQDPFKRPHTEGNPPIIPGPSCRQLDMYSNTEHQSKSQLKKYI